MIPFVILPFVLGLLSGSQTAPGPVVGTWACQAMSVGPYTGRPCRLEPWLKLFPDKTYEWGQEKGKWEYAGQVLSLSGRSGKGRLDTGEKLIFEYDLHGKHYVLTLYQR